MEILLTLIKYLTATLTPLQFLGVLALFGVVVTLAVRFALNKRREIRALIKGEKEEDSEVKQLQSKIEALVTKEELDAALEKIHHALDSQLAENVRSLDQFKEKFVEISMLRHEIMDKEFARLFEEISENRKIFSNHHEHSNEQTALILSTTHKIQDTQIKIGSQLDNIDDTLKTIVPEFRNYHRELTNDLKVLSRDLALIERSIQLSINSGSAVKLR